MARVTDLHSLYDFIGYVVLCAPDRFPQRDYLPEDEQMNLDRAFIELKNGVRFVGEPANSLHNQTLSAVLDEALALYKAGNEVKAAHRLQDFQDLVFSDAGHA